VLSRGRAASPPATETTPSPSRIFHPASRLYFDPDFVGPGSTFGPACRPDLLPSLLPHFLSQGILCIGEEHNNPMHHSAELRMLRAMRENTPKHVPVTLGLEMLERTPLHSAALDDFVFGNDTPEDLRRRTSWDSSWGWSFDYYKELLSYAKAAGIRIRGISIPGAVGDAVERIGIDRLRGHKNFPEVDLSNAEHRERYLSIRFGDRAPTVDPAEAQRAYEAQTLKEEFMAETVAVNARDQGGKIMVIAGRDHIAGKRGVPDRIHRRLRALNWGMPVTMALKGADWDTSGGRSIPLLEKAPGQQEADWVWFMKRHEGCIMM